MLDFSNASPDVQNVNTLLQNLLNKFYPNEYVVDFTTLEVTKTSGTDGTATVTQNKSYMIISAVGQVGIGACYHNFNFEIPDMRLYSKIKLKFTVSGNIQGNGSNGIYMPQITVGGYYVDKYLNGEYIVEYDTDKFIADAITLGYYSYSEYATNVQFTGITLYP